MLFTLKSNRTTLTVRERLAGDNVLIKLEDEYTTTLIRLDEVQVKALADELNRIRGTWLANRITTKAEGLLNEAEETFNHYRKTITSFLTELVEQ